MKKDVFINPVIGDRATFLKLSENTGHRFSLIEIDLVAGGGNTLHYHNAFSETFTVLNGELAVQVNKEIKVLQPGESFTVPPRVLHCFSNKTKQPATFHVTITPGHTGFENGIKIAYGLAADGLTNKKSIPKNFTYLALLFTMSDGNIPGLFSLMTPLLRWAANRARKRGIEQELINRYCN